MNLLGDGWRLSHDGVGQVDTDALGLRVHVVHRVGELEHHLKTHTQITHQ